MIKHGFEKFNYDYPLEDKLPAIIEAFVSVYGEKYRQQIENRIKNTTYFFVEKALNPYSIEQIKNHFSGLEENASDEEIDWLENEYERVAAPFIEHYQKVNAIKQNFDKEFEDVAKDYFCKAFGCDREVLPKNTRAYYEKLLKLQQGDNLPETTCSIILQFLHKITKGLPSYRKTLEEYIGTPTKAEHEAYSRHQDLKMAYEKFQIRYAPYVRSFNKKTIPLNLSPEVLSLLKGNLYKFLIRNPSTGLIAQTVAYPEQNDYSHPQIFCFFPSLFQTSPGTILHEFGHAVQTTFPIDRQYERMSGRDSKTGLAVKCYGYRPELEKLESLDETLNEYLTYLVEDKLDKDTFPAHRKYLFSAYTLSFPVIKDFFDEFEDELIECAMSSDPDLIFKKFPKTEILQLSNAIKHLHENSQSAEMQRQLKEGYDGKSSRFDYLVNFQPSGDNTDLYLKYSNEIKWLTKKIRLMKSQMNNEDFNEEEKFN